MANRYWVGGTNNWNGTAGTKWALTSGGAGGQTEPTTSDDVFFDAASGAVVVTAITSNPVNCKSINFTGFTGTFTGAVNLTVDNGNMTLGSGMTYSHSGIVAFNGTGTITCNGVTITSDFRCQSSAVATLGDDFISSNQLVLTQGTFNANNKNVTCTIFSSNNSFVRTLTMGSGLWTLTGAGVSWSLATTTNLTFNKNTANIKITDTSSSAVSFQGGGLIYNNLWFSRGASTGSITLSGSNTFADLKDTGTAAHSLLFTTGTTTTVTTFTVSGTAGNVITLNSTDTATFNLTCASGTVSCDYLNIQHCIAAGGATFYAGSNSVNNQDTVTAGSGWIFGIDPHIVVTTQSITVYSQVTALGNGNIVSATGTPDIRGFVYDTSSKTNPGNVAPAVSGYANNAADTGSFSLGAFTKLITGLAANTTYYIRAYARAPGGYCYGSQITLTTAAVGNSKFLSILIQ